MTDDDTPPTITHADGRQEWRTPEGKWHRLNDKPAFTSPNGCRMWWVNGERHRGDDKPAMIWANGTEVWYVNGQQHREDDKPAVWNVHDGFQEWRVHDQLHRNDDKPATCHTDGWQQWWVHGAFIRQAMVTDFSTKSLRFAFLRAVTSAA